MCGICGALDFGSGRAADAAAVARMADRLIHRGPDSSGLYTSPGGAAALGFRRLSIIDLRSDANQPLGNEDGAVQVIFNGEIYNFQELRRGLLQRGHRFRSQADTEVIVHLYEELGDRAIDALDGMFAIAIWDERAQRLVLARDRAGKKPLFVWRDGARVVFGSEIKALLAHPAVHAVVDPKAIALYLLYGYVPHPQTAYVGIEHVEPGTTMTIERSGQTSVRRYWHLEFAALDAPADAIPYGEAVSTVRRLVSDAVERRLISDVPLGAFLSGGIDSTIVVGVMSRLLEEPVRTFTIGFDDNPAFDESAIARSTAARLGTRHTEFRVRASAVDLLDTLVWHHDGPFADSSAIPTYLVSQLTRQHVTVALTGDGGDEVFAGYLRFGAALAADRIPAAAAWLARPLLAMLPSPSHERHVIARARRFFRAARLPLEERSTAWAGVFYDDVEHMVSGQLRTDRASIDRRRNYAAIANDLPRWAPLDRLLAINFHSYLHDDLLVKADRMTMANSLEARSPLLDRTLIEYVAKLPARAKLDGRRTKAILRDAFPELLPAHLNQRPKMGFGVPIDNWFRGELRARVTDDLLSGSARLRDYVDQRRVASLVQAHVSGAANHGHRLWALLTLERWLQLLPEWRAGITPPTPPRVAHATT
jgi:asparagine synthase (glutamine-hydrolysing)